MPNAPRFIAVGDLLVDIADGLGKAHKRLVDNSASPVGTLAVKNADVSVTFEMTSSALERDSTLGVGAPRVLGAKTLSFTSSTDQQESRVTNQAQIKLSIVSIAPQEPAPAPPVKPDVATLPAPARPIPTQPVNPTHDPTTDLLATIRVLRGAVKASKLSAGDKAAVGKGLDRAEKLVEAGDLRRAEDAIREVTARLRPPA